MTDILFVNPPLTPEDKYGTFDEVGSLCPPLNLFNLGAMTRAYGFATKIIDCEVLPYSFNETIEYLVECHPKYVGITASTLQIYSAAAISDALKKRDSGIVTIIGGNHISALPEDTMQRFPSFDIGVMGEGDITIVELLMTLESRGELNLINGISFRRSEQIVFTPPRALLENLDQLPFPSWDLLEKPELYKPAAQRLNSGSSAFIVTARGCPFQCTFCDRSVLGNRYRPYSISYIEGMIRCLQNVFSFSDLTVFDENLVISKARLFEFCALMRTLSLSWSCNARVDLINEDMLRVMKASGCWLILYGIENGSNSVLREIKKGITTEQSRKAITLTKKAGIRSSGFFMLGCPTETKESLEMTIDLATQSGLDYITPFYFTPLPGSEIYQTYQKYGIFENDWKKLNTFIPLFIPYGLSKKDLLNAYKKLLLKFYLRVSFILYHIGLVRHRVYLKRLIKGMRSLIKTIMS